MRTRRIEQEQMQVSQMKKQKLTQKYESKSSVLSALDQERRAFSTLKRDDINDRLVTVRSRGSLHEMSRQTEAQTKAATKDQRIDQLKTRILKSREEYRNVKSSSKQIRITQVQK
jgi:hypothetical protein